MAGGETYDQRPRRRGGSWEEDPLFLIACTAEGRERRLGAWAEVQGPMELAA